jgi:hypothetical protein
MKSNCIEKICNIPLDSKNGDKSAFILAKESGFEREFNEIEIEDLKDYLKQHKTLIDNWGLWSMDKRTKSGLYLKLDKISTIGELNENGQLIFNKDFESEVDACAEYIYREVSSILKIEKIK